MPEGHITVVHQGFVLLLDQQQSGTERRPSGSCSGALFMDKVEIFVWMASVKLLLNTSYFLRVERSLARLQYRDPQELS